MDVLANLGFVMRDTRREKVSEVPSILEELIMRAPQGRGVMY